ncbi:hypothetical protein LTR56_017501 [Elasticomyces elasticus]|nr:hypothetical protein LTR56_017501 [Elasticomyces elasticus]KAK3665098.1 hypothetical protein LTR22_004154 [Elasticomyces elasticus]KAK4931526.1 hypothetical protein LTR49_001914 [Elasticomyces elasticus]KAK5766685.1 hypothetical protein LTS12_003034 [Elasticomyces elasticus]
MTALLSPDLCTAKIKSLDVLYTDSAASAAIVKITGTPAQIARLVEEHGIELDMKWENPAQSATHDQCFCRTMTADHASGPAQIDLRWMGLVQVSATNTFRMGGYNVKANLILEEHTTTISQLEELGVKDVQLFIFGQDTLRPGHFLTGTVAIAGLVIRMYFTSPAEGGLLARMRHIGDHEDFKWLGTQHETHTFRKASSGSRHPAETPNSDQCHLLALPQELRDQILQYCLVDRGHIRVHGSDPPFRFRTAFGSSVPHGRLDLCVNRMTTLHLANRQLNTEMRQLAQNMTFKADQAIKASKDPARTFFNVLSIASDISMIRLQPLLQQATGNLNALKLRHPGSIVQMHIVVWNVGRSYSQRDLENFLTDVMVMAETRGWAPQIDLVSKLDENEDIEQKQSLEKGYLCRSKYRPHIRFLAVQPLMAGHTTYLYRIMQLHENGEPTLHAIVRPTDASWRHLLEPCVHSQAVMRRLLLDQSPSPFITAIEADVIEHELFWVTSNRAAT